MLAELLIMLGIDKTTNLFSSYEVNTTPDENGVYIDGNGDYRLLKSHTKVRYGFNKYGERVLKEAKSGKTLLNVDVEKAKENESKAKEQGYQFYLRSANGGKGLHKLGNDEISGTRYCKVGDANNKYYVRREISYIDPDTDEYCSGFFYMDMQYNLVAPSEMLLERDCPPRTELYEKIMNEHNHSERKKHLKDDVIMYLGKSSGFKYTHRAIRSQR